MVGVRGMEVTGLSVWCTVRYGGFVFGCFVPCLFARSGERGTALYCTVHLRYGSLTQMIVNQLDDARLLTTPHQPPI